MRADKRHWGRIAATMVLAGVSLAPGGPAEASELSNQLTVPADGQWVNTGIDVMAGGSLRIAASGTWIDGVTESGPNGSDKPWPDNFLNWPDIGACASCARTLTLRWGALEGYIGDAPPAPGSYTSETIRPEAEKVFFVGENYDAPPGDSGRLWLNKNADAYSGNTADNSGEVVADIDTSAPPADDGPGDPDFVCLGGVKCNGVPTPGHPG
ncbi:MAG TPA: hypothetical protein VGD29_13335 [Actinoplanes sp.]|jgi:hypothetical protein